MLEIVWFSSSSGNTDKFIEKLKEKTFGLTFKLNFVKINKNLQHKHFSQNPLILICPTYADGEGKHSVPKHVIQFLNIEQNRKNLLGVIGSGNKNFGTMFALAAEVISHKCQVPILHKFELAGSDSDIEKISTIITQLVEQ